MSAPAAPPPPMPPPAYGMPQLMPAQQSMLPVAGGVLLLISGIIGIAFWAYVIALGSSIAGLLPVGGSVLTGILLICGGIEIVFGLIGVIGGVMAFQRKMWGLGLAGAILGLFTIGWFFISSLLALIALILIAISRREFR